MGVVKGWHVKCKTLKFDGRSEDRDRTRSSARWAVSAINLPDW
jgi:hypothetical protein